MDVTWTHELQYEEERGEHLEGREKEQRGVKLGETG